MRTAPQLPGLAMYSGAVWGPGGRESCYRYRLWREWTEVQDKTVAFVMLNPSTATEEINDPTVRRCIGFAQAWGARRLEVLNLFALRSTDPRELYRAADPVGPQNDHFLVETARECQLVVCAWGVHGEHLGRGRAVHRMLVDAGCRPHFLRLTKDGHPSHPLYLAASLTPQPWEARLV